MSVKINISPLLKHLTNGVKVTEANGSTVGQCVEHLGEQFPEIKQALFDKTGKLRSYIDIYINNESAYPNELAKPVKEGDELSIALTIGGG